MVNKIKVVRRGVRFQGSGAKSPVSGTGQDWNSEVRGRRIGSSIHRLIDPSAERAAGFRWTDEPMARCKKHRLPLVERSKWTRKCSLSQEGLEIGQLVPI